MLQQKKKQTLRRHLQVFHILKNYLAQRSRREREREREYLPYLCTYIWAFGINNFIEI